MGSAIGAYLSYKKGKDTDKILRDQQMYDYMAKKEAQKNTPAEAKTADVDDSLENAAKKRKGIQATMLASKDTSTVSSQGGALSGTSKLGE